jgi:micrococcal nuclease
MPVSAVQFCPWPRAVKRSLVLLWFVALVACDRSTPKLEELPLPLPSGTVEPRSFPSPPSITEQARVARVSDGDTIVLVGISSGAYDGSTGGRKARLIGVDTPEVFGQTECFGRKASEFTKRELGGKDVRVAYDIDRTDRFGRALVYVWLADGTFFNAALVSEGFASQLTVPPNVRYADLFLRLARDARENERGLWKECF